MNPTSEQIERAKLEAKKAQDSVPATTCDHRGICCKAGCPNMRYAEFFAIFEDAVSRMPKERQIEITIGCVRRYLQRQSIEKTKPCVLLTEDNMCSVYEQRPLKCRMYGLYPRKTYERFVEDVARENGVEKEKVPLCQQCDRVKVKPEFMNQFPSGKLPVQMIKDLESRLQANDLALGVPKEVQDQDGAYLTYHDWHLLTVFGEDFMVALSQIRMNASDDEKDAFVAELESRLAGASNA